MDQYLRAQVPQLSATVALSAACGGPGEGASIGCIVAIGVRLGIVGSAGIGGITNGIAGGAAG
jgi:hypothetical protein